MKEINIYPILSSLHDDDFIKNERINLLNNLNKLTGYKFNIVNVSELYNKDLGIILIESGGSENYFLNAYKNLHEPFIFLTYNHNNSLAASLEILAFLGRNNKKGEILHGSYQNIANRIIKIINEEKDD